MGKLFLCGKFDIFKCAQGEEAVISSFGYTYYTDGNMRTKTETILNNTSATIYIYDGAGRLVSETTDGDTISYTYDARGNRVHMNNAGTVTTYSYDANNRLLSETTQGESIAYTYDANGNTLSAGSKSYTYNSRGQQTGYTDGTTTASYAYNPSGLRSAKTVGGATKYFVYNGMNIVYEYDAGGTEATVYYYGLNRTHNSDGEIYVYDAHGDVIQLVKDNAVVVSYTYDAFGNITEQIGTSENPFLYCGEYFDAETETYYLRARYYNPANGRFTQQDAWGYMNASDPLSLNLYTYCANNPVMYVDPSGHIVTEWDKLYCSETELNIIEEATFEWQDASARGDAVGMTTAHEKANAVRKPYLTHYESISDMGYITITLKQLDIDSGVKVVTLNGNQYLDVTMAIYAALYETCESGNVFQNTAVLKYFYFISLVNHDHAWDIKRPERWQETIGSTFPGYNKYALFNGRFFTPEDLGNLTYGYIGAHLGMGSGILRLGSFVAAGAPLGGDALFNESKDSGYVQLGVDLYLNGGIWQ